MSDEPEARIDTDRVISMLREENAELRRRAQRALDALSAIHREARDANRFGGWRHRILSLATQGMQKP